jgi:hypothetical protein
VTPPIQISQHQSVDDSDDSGQWTCVVNRKKSKPRFNHEGVNLEH